MFLSLFYLLRANGLSISPNEWITLHEGLRMGLHASTLTGFYRLCKAIVIHSETNYDKFDQVFLEYFNRKDEQPELSKELLFWLNHPELSENGREGPPESTAISRDLIDRLFTKRLQDQKDEHNGGKRWIGTSGYTTYGNQGKKSGGIRVGGEAVHGSAYRIVGERRYRDWHGDNALDARQFQVAFRRLRQLTAEFRGLNDEMDVEATVRKTCESGGILKIEPARPRKNTIKVVLFIDSGGSMETYQSLCSMLFQSVQKAGNFKELKIYYFHNVLRKNVYLDPTCDWRSGISLDSILNQLAPEYRVIFVGDAIMTPEELLSGKRGAAGPVPDGCGLQNFLRLKKKYSHIIWLHPQPRPLEHNYFTKTFEVLDSYFDMYPLTVDGLTCGIKKLVANQ
ncbi:VWA containing CoxE family protein [Oscillibacter sp. GMB15532]|uniref:VWA containing CoxE family protein n=1 Tax=Oscillibacter sp. GMB15532 TaxID=3230022 RepID=UPI0034DFEB03